MDRRGAGPGADQAMTVEVDHLSLDLDGNVAGGRTFGKAMSGLTAARRARTRSGGVPE